MCTSHRPQSCYMFRPSHPPCFTHTRSSPFGVEHNPLESTIHETSLNCTDERVLFAHRKEILCLLWNQNVHWTLSWATCILSKAEHYSFKIQFCGTYKISSGSLCPVESARRQKMRESHWVSNYLKFEIAQKKKTLSDPPAPKVKFVIPDRKTFHLPPLCIIYQSTFIVDLKYN
jgi:hypothetical protein